MSGMVLTKLNLCQINTFCSSMKYAAFNVKTKQELATLSVNKGLSVNMVTC